MVSCRLLRSTYVVKGYLMGAFQNNVNNVVKSCRYGGVLNMSTHSSCRFFFTSQSNNIQFVFKIKTFFVICFFTYFIYTIFLSRIKLCTTLCHTVLDRDTVWLTDQGTVVGAV